MRLVDHGAACCGIKHIFNMDNSTEAELDRFLQEACPPDNNNRLVEIALSSRQIGAPGQSLQGNNPPDGWPSILQRKGFRLVSRFRNSNSGNEVFIFHFVPRFLSLLPADMPGMMRTWEHQYVAPDLATVTVPRAIPAAAGRWVRSSHETIQVGSRVRLGRTVGRLNQHLAGVTTRPYRQGNANPGWYIQWDGRDVDPNEGFWSFDHIEVQENPDEEAPAPVAVPEPTIVFSTYHNVFRDRGRSGAGYDSAEAARWSAPRCRRRDRRDIFSDGTVIWSENV